MGRDAVIEEFKKDQAEKKAKERARFLAKTKEVITTMADAAEKNARILKRISDVLQEEMTYTDNKGVTRTIKGFENDKENNTLGTKDVFNTNEFRGQPFKEVSRNMHTHFKMFCITKGMTDEEILSLADENPAPETLDKMRGLKEEFFQMVTNTDMDKISDMYVGICEYFEKKLPLINQCTNPEGVLNATDYLIVTRGSGSYLQQTLDLNDVHRNEKQTELIKSINEKLSQKGKTYTLNDVEKTTMPVEYIAAAMDNYAELKNDPKIINKPQLELDFELEDIKKEDFEDEHFYESCVTDKLFVVLDITNKVNEVAKGNGKNPLNTFTNIDNSKTVQKTAVADVFESVLDNAYFSDIDSMAVADDLTNKLANHKKYNIFGRVKANTDKYENVLNQLKNIQGLEHKYDDKQGVSAKDMKEAYETLITVTKEYLDNRNPNSTEGKERYRLMLETMDLAKRASEKYGIEKDATEAVIDMPKEKEHEEVKEKVAIKDIIEQEKEAEEEKQVEVNNAPEKKEEAQKGAEIDQVEAAALHRKLNSKFKETEEFKTLQENIKNTLKDVSEDFENQYTFEKRQNFFAGYVSLKDLDKRLNTIKDKNYSTQVFDEMNKLYDDITAGNTIISVINSTPFQKVIQNNPFDDMDAKLKPIGELYDEVSAEVSKEKSKVSNKGAEVKKEAGKQM